MFAIHTYEQIEEEEKRLNEQHIVVLLLVRPDLPGAADILREFNYIHYNSGRFCSVYAVGYTDDAELGKSGDYQAVPGLNGSNWYYSDKAFVEFKNRLEGRLEWRYQGEIELIVLQSNPEGRQILNFQNYVVIDVNHGVRKGYLDSFPRFMEALVRSARSEVDAAGAIKKTRRQSYKISGIVCGAIDGSKRIPTPVKALIRDRLFYRTANMYRKAG